MWYRPLAASLVALVVGCAPTPPPPPPPPPPPVLPEAAWTARPLVVLRAADDVRIAARPFTRLEVAGSDSLGLRVRCSACGDTVSRQVAREDILVPPGAFPDDVAGGSLAEFALAVRAAAERQDVYALRPVMAPDFSFALIGGTGADEAIVAWRWDGYRALKQVPALLDRGLVELREGLWVAPPEFQARLHFHDLRLGFRRNARGRWEWLFLLRSDG